jgi:hypothetical protein
MNFSYVPLLRNYKRKNTFSQQNNDLSKINYSLNNSKQQNVEKTLPSLRRISSKSLIERRFKSLSLCLSNKPQAFNCAPLAKPESFSDIFLSIQETKDQNSQFFHSYNKFGNIDQKLIQENFSIENEKIYNKNVSLNDDIYYDDSINLKNPMFNLQLEKNNERYQIYEVKVFSI